MKILDPGHHYQIDVYDGSMENIAQLRFMKHEGEGYPGNIGQYPGTNSQEVIRVLIDRTIYLHKQIPCSENLIILQGLRSALLAYETRAARRHGRELKVTTEFIEQAPTCRKCGHIGCQEKHNA